MESVLAWMQQLDFQVSTLCGSALALVFCSLLLWFRHHAIFSQAFSPELLGFRSTPLIGSLWDLLHSLPRLHDALLETTAQCSYRTWAFSVPFLPTFIVVTRPDDLEYVLKTKPNNFIKGKHFQSNLGQILGRGIFAVDGQEWYWQRKQAAHVFNVRSFKAYTSEVFADCLDRLVGRLSATATTTSSSSNKAPNSANAASNVAALAAAASAAGGTVDLHDLMYRFTLDTFGRIGFGVDLGCLTAPGKIPFAQAFDRAQVIGNIRFWLPFWRIIQLLSGDTFKIRHDVKVIRDFAKGIIHQRRQQLEKHEQQQQAAGKGRKAGDAAAAADSGGADADAADGGDGLPADLLSLFMSAQTPEGQPLSEEQLVDTVLNFIIAGRDTTAQALSWTFYLLMQHPEVEAKLLQEAEQVLGPCAAAAAAGTKMPSSPTSSSSSSGDSGGSSSSPACKVVLPSQAGLPAAGPKPCYEQLRQLKYAKAVFLEGLRLYPSVPVDCKYAVAADKLPDGTAIPAGACMTYPIYTINRLPSFWGEDANQFRPERWLEMSVLPSAYQYASFNAGPRICLGKALAELEAVYVLVGLLQRFRFSLAQQQPVTYTLATTLPMKGGMMVKVEPRS